MSRTKYDYQLLEDEYIHSPDMSIRELCRKHDIKTWSTVAARAKERNWDEKRARVREKAFEHEIEAYAELRARKMAKLWDTMLDVIEMTFIKMGVNMQADDYIVMPQDLVKLIEKMQLLNGGPTAREEIHGYNLNADLPAELLRELAAAARANGAGRESMGQSALPLAPGARKVN